jgi:hypothetical protein
VRKSPNAHHLLSASTCDLHILECASIHPPSCPLFPPPDIPPLTPPRPQFFPFLFWPFLCVNVRIISWNRKRNRKHTTHWVSRYATVCFHSPCTPHHLSRNHPHPRHFSFVCCFSRIWTPLFHEPHKWILRASHPLDAFLALSRPQQRRVSPNRTHSPTHPLTHRCILVVWCC